MKADELQSRYGVEGRCRFFEREGGLVAVELHSATSECEIVLQGAHVTRFARSGETPILFLSEKSFFQNERPIRGGVPLIFPWFGPHPAKASSPAHGFARTALWSVESVEASDPGVVTCTLELRASEATQAHWPRQFNCRYRVSAGEALELSLEVRNDSGEGITFEEALHTYIAVGDIERVTLSGLEGIAYIDKTDGMKRKKTGDGPLRITKETDSVFPGTKATCIVRDESLNRDVVIEKTGSGSTVVWNPWIDKAKAFSDFGDDEWKRMICVETANATDDAVHLPAGEAHTMTARISASSIRERRRTP